MKIKMILRSVITAAVLFAGSQLASAQVFSFDTAALSPFGYSNLDGIHASGSIDFNTADEINLFISNDSANPDWTQSYITGIWLLKPFNKNDPSTVVGGTLSSVPAGTSYVSPAGNAETFNGTGTGADPADYFSVGISNGNGNGNGNGGGAPSGGIGLGGSGSFTFTIDTLPENIDFKSYLESETPHIFVRFRGIEPGGESAKTYAFIITEIPIVPVPEPSHIAVLALAGLGGFILIRRRLVRKG